jgi:hypothetical protein
LAHISLTISPVTLSRSTARRAGAGGVFLGAMVRHLGERLGGGDAD